MNPEAPVTKQFIAARIKACLERESLFLGNSGSTCFQSGLCPTFLRDLTDPAQTLASFVLSFGLGKLKTAKRGAPLLDLGMPLGKNARRCMPRKSSGRSKKMSRKELRDLDVKIHFLEGIVDRDPHYVEALQILGDHYTQRGKYNHSLKVDEQLSRLEPRNPLAFYNLACSYSLNGEFDLAAAALEQALSLGYRDFKWLARDPDLKRLRKHPVFRTIEDKIRRMKVKAL